MIKKKLLVALCAAVFAGATLLTSCGGTGSFLPEYEIRSGSRLRSRAGSPTSWSARLKGWRSIPKRG
ncbi:MAG: hypothetical protein ACLR06_13725 [Christensenellaceae bacterium]